MKGYAEEEEMLEIGTFQRRDQYHPYEQQEPSIEEFPPRPARGTPRGPASNAYSQSNSYYPDEFASPSPGWPPSIAGRSESQTLVDSAESRSSVRSWRTGQQTPVDSTGAPRYSVPFHNDSGPSTPMVRKHISAFGFFFSCPLFPIVY